MDVNVKVRDEETTLVEEARELETKLKKTFGRSALTTRVEDEGGSVVVSGDGWQFTARGDELIFKPGGAAYRIVRDVDALDAVERDGDDLTFVFGDEMLTLGRGVEHRV